MDVMMKVRGTEIPVHVETEGFNAGKWSATIDGESYNAGSWDHLRSLLMDATDVEINIPFTMVTRAENASMQGNPAWPPHLSDGVTRRPHASERRAVLVTWADGSKGKVQYGTTLRPMDGGTRARLLDLLAQYHRISGEINEIISEHKIDLPEEVERARGQLLAGGPSE